MVFNILHCFNFSEFKEDGGNSTISRVVFTTSDQAGSPASTETNVTGSLTEEMIHDIEKVCKLFSGIQYIV